MRPTTVSTDPDNWSSGKKKLFETTRTKIQDFSLSFCGIFKKSRQERDLNTYQKWYWRLYFEIMHWIVSIHECTQVIGCSWMWQRHLKWSGNRWTWHCYCLSIPVWTNDWYKQNVPHRDFTWHMVKSGDCSKKLKPPRIRPHHRWLSQGDPTSIFGKYLFGRRFEI